MNSALCSNHLSQVFAEQKVGVKQTAEHIWLVSFMDYDLGYFDDETCRLEPIEDPFGPKLSPMSPEWTLTRVASPPGFEPGFQP